MSTTYNNRYTSRDRFSRKLLDLTHMLIIGLACRLVLVVPASAQSVDVPTLTTGSILGSVVDSNNDTIPNATVVLQKANGDPLTVLTADDGSFAFHDVTPGIAHQITVAAEGFAEWSSSITVEPGQETTLTPVTLHILAVQRAVTVTYASQEVAAQQLKAEEQQRVFAFIPNIYVAYEPHPEPLTARMKFHLAYKGLTHPTFFAFQAAWAGVQQAADTPDYRQGAKGYAERFGANLASGVSESLFANAILPSLLHQDPRYFYQGSDTKWSRARHAMLAPFVCKGDNGNLQPNYSQLGGSLISAALAN